MRHARTLFLLVMSLLYPLAIFFLLKWFEPRWLAVLPCGLAAFRGLAGRDPFWLWVALAAALLAAWTLLGNSVLPLKLYPVLVNVALLFVFSLSLRFGPPVIERLARLREPDLPRRAVAYTRTVTKVWCVFFVFNGGVALLTALWGSDYVWALYNGLIAYVLIGVLFAGEWLVRQRVKADGSD